MRRVFVASRTGTKVDMEPGRDISLEEVKEDLVFASLSTN